jgi:hypothetical protein
MYVESIVDVLLSSGWVEMEIKKTIIFTIIHHSAMELSRFLLNDKREVHVASLEYALNKYVRM